MPPRTMFEKIWDAHVVHEEPGQPALIYIDLHLVHEVTSPQAFDGLRMAGRRVRRPACSALCRRMHRLVCGELCCRIEVGKIFA